MFDWFKKSEYKNVLPFPGTDIPKIVPPKRMDRDPTTYYTIGITDDNRVIFQVGYSTLTMNDVGVQNLIDQLELFKSQLEQER